MRGVREGGEAGGEYSSVLTEEGALTRREEGSSSMGSITHSVGFASAGRIPG